LHVCGRKTGKTKTPRQAKRPFAVPHTLEKAASAISKRHWAVSCFAARTEEKPLRALSVFYRKEAKASGPQDARLV